MKHHILLVGQALGEQERTDWAAVLEQKLPNVAVSQVAGGVEALTHLAQEPDNLTVVIIDLYGAELPAEALVHSLREISPGVEIILICPAEMSWDDLDLPLKQRPILLVKPISATALISCVSKLTDLAENKRDYARMNRNFKGHLSFARKNVEAILALLNRPVGMGMISTRRDGFITFYNPVARQLTGYSQDELPHIRKWADTLLTDSSEMLLTLSRFEQAWTKGANREELPLNIRHKDGKAVRLSMSFLVLQDDSGEPRQLVALMFDPKNRAEAQACKELLEFGDLPYYSYHLRNGFETITPSAVRLINQAFSNNLNQEQIRGKLINELPLTDEMLSIWQGWLEHYSLGGRAEPSLPPPLGLPGQRVLDHSEVAPLATEEGGQAGVVAIMQLKEELKADVHQRLSSDVLCRLTLMSIPHPFILLKALRNKAKEIKDFQCLDFNQAAVNLLRRGDNGKSLPNLMEIFPEEEAYKKISTSAKEATETGIEHDFEFSLKLRRNDKRESMVHFWTGKVGDGAALFFRDITAKREEEEALKQYRHIFAHMEESIVVTDLDGRITDWNPASNRMYGYRKKEIIGKPAHILTSDKRGEPLNQEARDILRDGEVWKGEYRFTRRDGRPGVASTVFAVLKDDEGRSYGTVGLSHDVTEEKKMEERLRIRTRELQEKNVALNTLLRHAEEERLRACEQVAADVTSKITEGLTKIMGAKQNPELVDNLGRLLLRDLGQSVSLGDKKGPGPVDTLTEKELEVARLIRMGKTTEEIAFILGKSPDTVRLQRISIRKKLGLKKRDNNLHEALNQLELLYK